MKVITVAAKAKTLNDLLKKAGRKEVFLQSTMGRRFVLVSIDGWESFEIGEDEDITKNKKLMKHLTNRRSRGKGIPLEEVKARLHIKTSRNF